MSAGNFLEDVEEETPMVPTDKDSISASDSENHNNELNALQDELTQFHYATCENESSSIVHR